MVFLLIAARVLLASVFLLAGTAKFINPVGTRTALRDFGVPGLVVRPLVVLLPLVELSIAALLVPASLAWYGGCAALALLAAFLVAVGIAMVRGRNPECHCFGQLSSGPIGRTTIIRNCLLALCAGWLLISGRGHSGPEIWTWIAGLNDFETKVAAVAGCVLAFLFVRVLVRAPRRPEPAEVESSFSFPFFSDEEEAANEEPAVAAPKAAPVSPVRAIEPQFEPPPKGPLDIGLPIGTPAPAFELPSINGEMRSLQSLFAGGRDVLLIFSSPYCRSCEALASNLGKWTLGRTGLPNIAVISRGSPEENRKKLKGLHPSQVLLQQNTEIARAYDCLATPTGVLVSTDGLVRSMLVSGGPAIRQLLLSSAKQEDPGAAKSKSAQRASVLPG